MAHTYTWPDSDPELLALIEGASDQLLHELMCDCAAHALEVCEPLHRAADYTMFPEDSPLVVKRRWLAGEASTAELEEAQQAAVWYCYWGSPLALGAAVLGAAWYPGGGLSLAEDEHYAESMTWHDTAAEAIRDVMNEAVKAVGEVSYLALWRREGTEKEKAAAGEASLRAQRAEESWQKAQITSRLTFAATLAKRKDQ
jgi:hypothetical protein